MWILLFTISTAAAIGLSVAAIIVQGAGEIVQGVGEQESIRS